MPIMQLPLMKGVGKDFKTADYVDLLPVNMLATPKEVIGAAGYLRSFPGITKLDDVSGVSRGVMFNVNQNSVYRVLGNKLYDGQADIHDVDGNGRVSMACSYTSQAVAFDGAMSLFRYDGTVKQLSNWPVHLDGVAYAQYEIGSVRDICRSRGRYIWVKGGTDTFGVTDLDNESHPDRFRPFYRAESQPDGIVGVDTWRDFVVCFGSSTIEYFSLTGSTDTSSAIYVAQPSLMVQKGIAGTYCKTRYGDSHAILSNQSSGAPSIYVISSGRAESIATASIEKILRGYNDAELASGVMETLRFDSHELLIIHLPRHVLCYDAAASSNGPQWSLFKTGLFDEVYRGIDFMYSGGVISCGDKNESITGVLSFDVSEQYGLQQEHLLYTPIFKADNSRVFDFSLESSTGVAQRANKIFISASADGINYGREQLISGNAPFVYDKRVLWRRVGRIRKNICFKIRVITSSPVTLSNCSVRVE